MQILATMRKMLEDQEAEDRRNREKRHAAAMRYQQDLDSQVTAMRQKSFDSLMSKLVHYFYFIIFFFSFLSLVIDRYVKNYLSLYYSIETMSEQEMKYNSDLVRKTNVSL